ncbi:MULTISPECIES: quorum sensing histidine kinase QseC [Enterobacter]|uniref:Sensor protein QseC n=1 Tax=Enterobacter kobei TaxID=208224 RepID=A0AAJ6LKY3_9ENTR|nr:MULTISPECIES: quorum sensing histidine kinase QseC [Enterobacter]AMZ76139.1 two-component system sensor histidine kinase QseC [Enterobacter sp. ODB01]EHF8262343.1 two-component system sensor histidine kinase QseC [Enterobacter kobei]EKY1591142.1 two-component system sensor histidine kinase QseC [Enterobacter kobei]ELK6696586.1 two-component system sensor histidine kinase QseC [Enterobacter kobei]KJL59631.1 sensor protein QseC [Enterobacter kobei]
MKLSLKLRLTLLFLVLSLTAWFAASLVAWQQTTHKLDKLFDTQQMLFAKRLLTMELDELHAPARMREVPKKAKHGHLDDDALAFAIYASDGTMILNDGENGRDIPYHYRRDGFDDGRLQDDNDEWRFLWLTSPDGKYRVVVGQEWEYRQDMALDVVSSQLTPWLVALPVMLLLLIVLLSRELKPLKKLAQTLRARSPDATDALPIQGVPAEVRPLLDSLNHLFARTQEMMTRERRFTSDAAHELRSPLAALKVQTDVAQLSQDDPQAQEKALTQLHAGIDRASRLVDQLLTLSRLDSLDSLDGVEQIAMADLLQSAVMDIYPPAQQAGIDIRLNINAPEVTRTGQQLLLSLLVRNLLDNATRYSPRGSVVDVTLDARRFTVRDNGPGISLDALTRLGERFYRPPGQDATGSGLGLSIVKRIAALHGMHVALGNAPEGGFEVNVSW